MKKILMLIASLCVINTGFAMDHDQYAVIFRKMVRAIQAGDLAKVQELIGNSATQEARDNLSRDALRVAAVFGPISILKFLLKNGVEVNGTNDAGMTLVMLAASGRNEEKIIEVLAYIPLSEQEKIRHSIIALGLIKREQPNMYPDARKLITNAMIKRLAEEQMPRINQLLVPRSHRGYTARDMALGKDREGGLYPQPNIPAQLLDPTNPASYARIRTAVERNIRRILFGPQQNE